MLLVLNISNVDCNVVRNIYMMNEAYSTTRFAYSLAA
jgi:hypothetical protein